MSSEKYLALTICSIRQMDTELLVLDAARWWVHVCRPSNISCLWRHVNWARIIPQHEYISGCQQVLEMKKKKIFFVLCPSSLTLHMHEVLCPPICTAPAPPINNDRSLRDLGQDWKTAMPNWGNNKFPLFDPQILILPFDLLVKKTLPLWTPQKFWSV